MDEDRRVLLVENVRVMLGAAKFRSAIIRAVGSGQWAVQINAK